MAEITAGPHRNLELAAQAAVAEAALAVADELAKLRQLLAKRLPDYSRRLTGATALWGAWRLRCPGLQPGPVQLGPGGVKVTLGALSARARRPGATP